MLLIGNQIRLSRPALASAASQRTDLLIKSLARRQVEAGANWLLLDLGPQRKNGAEDLEWLVKTVHDEVTVPLVLRSDDPAALEAGIRAARDKVLLDATLPGAGGLQPYLDLATRYGPSVALPACPRGLPLPTEERIEVITGDLVPRALEAGLSIDRVYVDPLVTALTCDQPMVPVTVETVRLLKIGAEPSPNVLVHLYDVSDGAADAARPYIVQAFLAMLLAAGVDGVAANPLDPGLADTMRVVVHRDPANAYDRLLLRLYDVTKAEVELDPGFVDMSDPEQVKLWKTVQVLNNRLLYADSYLFA
jgi:5-methyltetrahydrofolate corrinoid/iron sulfur protein methyltransferase